MSGAQVSQPVRKVIFADMTKAVREVNEANGWFDESRTPLEGHMLIVTEVAELSEAWREHGFEDQTKSAYSHAYRPGGTGCCAVCDDVQHDKLPKPEGYGSEAADILIRLLDQCDRDGVDLVAEFDRKLAYNATRGYKHGGKRA
jgi:NTP pyrophosphatase (non-canonical NTP hydrolase)